MAMGPNVYLTCRLPMVFFVFLFGVSLWACAPTSPKAEYRRLGLVVRFIRIAQNGVDYQG